MGGYYGIQGLRGNMKRLLIIVLLMSTARASAYFVPTWDEFCPFNMRNISTTKNYKLPVKKYWQQRKIVFEKNIEYCNSSKDKDACYMELRKIENDKTTNYLNDIRNKAIMMNGYYIQNLKY